MKDKNTWWGRIEAMTEEEMDNLPDDVLKKYQSIIIQGEEAQLDRNFLDNQSNDDRWKFVRNEKRVLTQEQKDAIQTEMQIASAEKGQERIYNYEKEGYMKRQPRFDLTKHSYNYEQFRQFTQLYEEAWRKDRSQLTKFYKMVNYVKAHPDSKDTAAVNFRKKYFIDLIEVPEEFKNETTESLDEILQRDKRARRPSLRAKARIDMSKYDAWRAFDRTANVGGAQQRCIRRVKFAPASLVKAFGLPQQSELGFQVSGAYHFEDSNLDCFTIHDFKQTTLYHGPNREDEYYEKQLKKPPHKRDKRWPTVEEFWTSTEPIDFRLHCSTLADWIKFRIWIRRTVQEAEGKAKGFDD